MSELATLELLFSAAAGRSLLLPDRLARVYGPLTVPATRGRPAVIGNFVTTLDGVVSLNIPGQAGGGPISGFNRHDRMLMGILRAAADVVIVGAGTLRAVPQHRWTPEYVYPDLATDYRTFRAGLGKAQPPLTVLVTAGGDLDLGLPVFQAGEAPVLIVTTERGARVLGKAALPASVQLVSAGNGPNLSAREILGLVEQQARCDLILTEGGPRLIGDFLAERCLDELYLTLAPQIAGRDSGDERPGLVAGRHFAPDAPLWGRLVDLRRAESHLFLRYAFDSADEPGSRSS